MSDKIENLQTAIRRYCINNSARWSEKYYEIASAGDNRSGFGYTDEALYIFPRYMLLNAILVEVERYLPEDFPTLDEAKRFFVLSQLKLKANLRNRMIIKLSAKQLAKNATRFVNLLSNSLKRIYLQLNLYFTGAFYLKKKAILFGEN